MVRFRVGSGVGLGLGLGVGEGEGRGEGGKERGVTTVPFYIAAT